MAGYLSVALFLGTVIFVFQFLARGIARAVRGDRNGSARALTVAAACIATYGVVLVAVALAMPRRVYPPGTRECFDDWCVSGGDVAPTSTTAAICPQQAGTIWSASITLFSDAKRVRQRATDAYALLEDAAGRQYHACSAPLPDEHGAIHSLTETLDPGDQFTVTIPFQLPAGAQPAGVVVNHGSFPEVIIIGSDQAFLHPHTLLQLRYLRDSRH